MSEVFKLAHVDMTAPRIELHNALALTGCEVSISNIAAGAAIPFVHRHVANEELYGVLAGKGELYIDGKVVQIEKGDWFRIDPEGRRAIRAAADSGITLICVTLHAPDDWNDHIRLYDYGFSLMERLTIDAPENLSVPVAGGMAASVPLGTDSGVTVGCRRGTAPDITVRAEYFPFVYAPVRKGDVLGKLVYLRGNRVIAEKELLALSPA